MRHFLRGKWVGRRTAILAVLTLGIASAADAQRSASPQRNVVRAEDGTPDYVRSRKKGFSLFANGDLAGTGMKNAGQFGWITSNLGPCADGFNLGECGDVDVGGGDYRFHIFEILWSAGTPPNEFRKIRKVYPEIGSAVRGGITYTHLHNFALFAGRSEFGPKDGTLGTLFKGEPSTEDGSCRDNTSPLNGYMTVGASLLAGSTCPVTWGTEGFKGPRPIPDSAYIRAFNADPKNFRFDYFRIADSEKDQTRFLGDFSTYGETSDHYTEILAAYGKVTKIGPRTSPTINGYPLGLDIRFEAFTFGLPTIANAVFYQAIVVNRTADVYGTGVDFDSLYMGLAPGWGSAQRSQVHYVPSQSAIKVASIGTSGSPTCNGATPAGGFGCQLIGFSNGAVGIIALKSPIGDLRNKLFTKPGAFFNPTSKFADDTIAFNHGHMCGFGGCWATTINVNDRRGFGLISSTEDNVLDGRSIGALTNNEYWRTFRSKSFPTRDGKFNRYTPGNWDFNNDGTPDTLFYDSCHSQGCVKVWADTMPGRQVNSYSNVGGVMTAGPFALKAGDTTAFVYAFVGGPDSASFEATVSSVIDAYMSFYLTPTAPPAPTIVATEVQPTEIGAPFVQIFYSNAPEKFVDPFLLKFGNELKNSSAANLVALRTQNPNLADQILARAVNNFSELYIYKSCDNGATFTGDADCDGDPAVGPTGQLIGAGFQPYAIITADTTKNGSIVNSFRDNNVIGGRTYLYSLVTRSRGFRTVIKDSTAANGVRLFVLTDTISGSLQRSGPSTAKVYVPISLAAGATAARISTFSFTSGNATAPVEVRFGNRVTGGTFTATFANRFIVKQYLNIRTGATVDSVFALDVISSATRAGAKGEVVSSTEIFVSSTPVQIAGEVTSDTTTRTGDVQLRVTQLDGLGFVLTNGANQPLFVSTELGAGDNPTTPDEFVSRIDFPGFTIALDQTTALDRDADFERVVLPNGDTLNVNVVPFAVNFQATSERRNNTSGTFIFNFLSDAFGPGAPFTFDSVNIANTGDVVRTSLAARAVATTGDVSIEAKRAYLRQFPADVSLLTANDTSTLPLRPFRFPFTVTDSSNRRPTTLAMISRRARNRTSTVRLGSGVDTLRVAIDSLDWVPGDEFVVLQTLARDSIVTSGDTTFVVVDPSTNTAFQVQATIVALGPVVLGCNAPVICNPVKFGTRGFSGYFNYQPNTRLIVDFRTPFSVASKVSFNVTPTASTRPLLTRAEKSRIRVVPNPYVFQSEFDEVSSGRQGISRVLFTNVPESGMLRVYSVSGQFLQQLSWTPADLNGTGDLPYNLRSREGTDLAAGLYIYVISTKSAAGKPQQVRGKFVVIR